MAIPIKPFRVLPPEEFERLSTAGKADYLREAVEAQKRVLEQFEKYSKDLGARESINKK